MRKALEDDPLVAAWPFTVAPHLAFVGRNYLRTLARHHTGSQLCVGFQTRTDSWVTRCERFPAGISALPRSAGHKASG